MPRFSPGHFDPPVRRVVVRSVRTSTRPCPSPTVVAARSGGGGGNGVPVGGSGRREASGGVREGESGPDVHLQRPPVVLHRQQVLAPGIDDFPGHIPPAEQGVADHHRPRHGQDSRQLEGGFAFVGLGIDADPGEHGPGVRGEGGDPADAARVAAAGLAVAGQVLGVGRVDPGGHPPGEDAFEGVGVEGGEGRERAEQDGVLPRVTPRAKAGDGPYWRPKRAMPAKLLRPMSMARAATPRMADSGCRRPCRPRGSGTVADSSNGVGAVVRGTG